VEDEVWKPEPTYLGAARVKSLTILDHLRERMREQVSTTRMQ
jgi:hypothetical protein